VATDRNALTWTSAQVLTDVRRKASLPVTSTDWTDAVVLREATDVLWSFTGWALAQGGEGRLLSSLDRTVTAALSGAYGAREFVIPPLAIAGTIDSVAWTDSTGTTQSRLYRVDSAEEPTFSTPTGQGSPGAYAILGDRIRVYPLPNSGGTLRITYQRRHPELVVDSAATAGTIASVASASSTTSTLTESLGLTGLAIGDTLDILRSQYPYDPIVANAEVTALPSGTTITVDQPVAMFSGHDLVGARVVRAGQSPYVAMPLELRTCFSEKVAANILRVMGDLQGSQASEQAATLELARVMQMLTPRAKRDKPKAINPYSHLRMRLLRWRG
jgi:hypothetical protein